MTSKETPKSSDIHSQQNKEAVLMLPKRITLRSLSPEECEMDSMDYSSPSFCTAAADTSLQVAIVDLLLHTLHNTSL